MKMLSWDNIKRAVEWEKEDGYWQGKRNNYSGTDQSAIETIRESCTLVSLSEPKGDGSDKLYLDHVYGWRSWSVQNFTLGGVGHIAAWEDSFVEAACNRFKSVLDPQGKPHVAPEEGCGCGIWSVKNYFTGAVLKQYRAKVLGVVANSGKLIHHEHGYRSQFAKIHRLFYLYGNNESPNTYNSICQFLSIRYEVECIPIWCEAVSDPSLPFGNENDYNFPF